MTRLTLPLQLATVLLVICSTTRCTWAFRSAPTNCRHVKVDEKAMRPGITGITWSNAPHRSSSRSSSAATSVSLLAFPTPNLSVVGAGVAGFYKASPILAGFLTASTKASLADNVAQRRDASTTTFDPKRNFAMALYSGLVLGALCEVMYNKVFPRLFGTEQCFARALKMTLFDGFVNAPLVWLWPAYVVKAVIYRHPKREAIQKYATDVKENGLLTKYWSLWLPMSMINFTLVPPHFRVAFAASISFFWMIILSVVANNGD